MAASSEIGWAEPPLVPEEELPPVLPKARVQETKRRNIKIRRNVELRNYGYTDGCAGCVAAHLEADPRPHSAACRARIESEILQDDAVRGEYLRAVKEARGEALPGERDEAASGSAGVAGAPAGRK